MGGASIPWRRSERRCSLSGASVGVGVAGSSAAAVSAVGVAAASDGFVTLHVGNQDMWKKV